MDNIDLYKFLDTEIKIGNKILPRRLILPAIAGFSDMTMRELCYQYGASLCYTEMVSCKGLSYKNHKTNLLLKTGKEEPITGIQLFGSDPYYFVKAVTDKRLDKFDVIDINLGCPVPKVVKNGEGSALMNRPELVFDIVKECVNVSGGRPITVKMRSGYDISTQNAPRIAELVEKAGGSAIIVHGRVREQFYSGQVNLNVIKEVKDSVGIPVIGNGNIIDVKSAQRMLVETGCDGLAVARAAIGRPYIFSELRGEKVEVDLYHLLRRHFGKLIEAFPERQAVNDFKKHFLGYLKGRKGTREIKNKVVACNKKEEMTDLIETFSHDFPFKPGEMDANN